MKLRNKKTGKIVDATMSYREDTAPIVVSETTCDENGQSQGWPYNSLAELNEEWEDYKEPEDYWFIDPLYLGYVDKLKKYSDIEKENVKELGLDFETEEEARLAIRKLKAWKRLKDKGFKFKYIENNHIEFNPGDIDNADQFINDMALIFGGEE